MAAEDFGDKTHEATPYRRQKAREEGQVVRSQDLASAGLLIAGLLILYRSRTLLGAMVGLNLAFEFLFSGLYHAKLNETMQSIDVAWIYVLLLAILGPVLARITPGPAAE